MAASRKTPSAARTHSPSTSDDSSASYKGLARHYRPQTFSDVVGQKPVVQTLRKAIESGRWASAYLFIGGRGLGKTTIARILAKGILCEKGPTPEPCGECDTCQEITASRHIDVLEIDAASNTGVDNVRDTIIQAVSTSPVRGRAKVFIIDEVHMLSASAFNALLKTIEEPPPHVVFIMATTDGHKVPATIRSRCQRFDFRPITREELGARIARIAKSEFETPSPRWTSRAHLPATRSPRNRRRRPLASFLHRR
jgi:DNA polymerase-3 subunit gamma/tau